MLIVNIILTPQSKTGECDALFSVMMLCNHGHVIRADVAFNKRDRGHHCLAGDCD